MRDSRAEARRWLRQAENDLAFGEVALRELFLAQACFIAQQTAEKALESLAYGMGERLVIGHSIVELLVRLVAAFRELRELRESTGVLDQYSVATRYPNGLPGGGSLRGVQRAPGTRGDRVGDEVRGDRAQARGGIGSGLIRV